MTTEDLKERKPGIKHKIKVGVRGERKKLLNSEEDINYQVVFFIGLILTNNNFVIVGIELLSSNCEKKFLTVAVKERKY